LLYLSFKGSVWCAYLSACMPRQHLYEERETFV
jgi:hypothetical protein